MTTTTITVVLSDEQAEALAQFCKRVGFATFRDYAKNEDEAYIMQDAMEVLAKELAESGHNPR